jgi:hypothetical protein
MEPTVEYGDLGCCRFASNSSLYCPISTVGKEFGNFLSPDLNLDTAERVSGGQKKRLVTRDRTYGRNKTVRSYKDRSIMVQSTRSATPFMPRSDICPFAVCFDRFPEYSLRCTLLFDGTPGYGHSKDCEPC